MFELIVFFDGVCVLCNGCVNFLFACDWCGVLCYVLFQGEIVCELFFFLAEDLGWWSMYYMDEGGLYECLDAVFVIVWCFGGVYVFFALVWLIFCFVCDVVYRIIVVNCYCWFGRREQCRLPAPEEKDRFLP